VWKHFVKKLKAISEDQFLALFPEAANKIEWWIRYIDENGDQKFSKTQEVRDA
jgi:hypothetical protein